MSDKCSDYFFLLCAIHLDSRNKWLFYPTTLLTDCYKLPGHLQNVWESHKGFKTLSGNLSDIAKLIKSHLIRIHLETIQAMCLSLWGYLFLKWHWNCTHNYIHKPENKTLPYQKALFLSSCWSFAAKVFSVVTVFLQDKASWLRVF